MDFQWNAGTDKHKGWRSYEEPVQPVLRRAYQNSRPSADVLIYDEMSYIYLDAGDMRQVNKGHDGLCAKSEAAYAR